MKKKSTRNSDYREMVNEWLKHNTPKKYDKEDWDKIGGHGQTGLKYRGCASDVRNRLRG